MVGTGKVCNCNMKDTYKCMSESLGMPRAVFLFQVISTRGAKIGIARHSQASPPLLLPCPIAISSVWSHRPQITQTGLCRFWNGGQFQSPLLSRAVKVHVWRVPPHVWILGAWPDLLNLPQFKKKNLLTAFLWSCHYLLFSCISTGRISGNGCSCDIVHYFTSLLISYFQDISNATSHAHCDQDTHGAPALNINYYSPSVQTAAKIGVV